MSYNESEDIKCHNGQRPLPARYICDVCGKGLCRICAGWWSGDGDARCYEHVDAEHCFPNDEEK